MKHFLTVSFLIIFPTIIFSNPTTSTNAPAKQQNHSDKPLLSGIVKQLISDLTTALPSKLKKEIGTTKSVDLVSKKISTLGSTVAQKLVKIDNAKVSSTVKPNLKSESIGSASTLVKKLLSDITTILPTNSKSESGTTKSEGLVVKKNVVESSTAAPKLLKKSEDGKISSSVKPKLKSESIGSTLVKNLLSNLSTILPKSASTIPIKNLANIAEKHPSTTAKINENISKVTVALLKNLVSVGSTIKPKSPEVKHLNSGTSLAPKTKLRETKLRKLFHTVH